MEEKRLVYKVVLNPQAQYTIWNYYQDIPSGWREVGIDGPIQKCQDYIRQAIINKRSPIPWSYNHN